MDLESKAFSSPRVDAHHHSPQKKSPAEATSGFNSNYVSSPDDSSVLATEANKENRKRTAVSHTGMSKSRKRNRVEDKNTVVVYNIPPEIDTASLKDFVKTKILEMHGKRVYIDRCRSVGSGSDRLTFFITFATSELADLAISLNGVQFREQTIYVSISSPGWSLDKTKKLRLCFDFCSGACDRHYNKCRHAHGVLDLKLYHNTVLNENRTIHIRGIPLRYPPKDFLNMLNNKFHKHHMLPFLTAFHARGDKGDALVEFADIRHAEKAYEILDGCLVSTCDKLEVRPWKSAYQSEFVAYFKDEAPPRKAYDQEKHSAVEWEDAMCEMRRLRDEVYRFRWQQKRLADLEEENDDCRRLLNEAQDDVRYYRDKYERERSYAKDARRMEDKLDDLERENDHLMRKTDDLRKSQNHSRSSGSYRDVENNLQDELRHTRRKYEESRDRIHDLKRELDKTMEENEVLVRDSDCLKSSMERLESNRNRVKMENEKVGQRQDDLERRLDEALSEISTLNEALATTQLQLKDVESEKGSMDEAVADLQAENETLQEEMEQMRMNRAMELGFTGGSDEL